MHTHLYLFAELDTQLTICRAQLTDATAKTMLHERDMAQALADAHAQHELVVRACEKRVCTNVVLKGFVHINRLPS
jgi:hypothetical protein